MKWAKGNKNFLLCLFSMMLIRNLEVPFLLLIIILRSSIHSDILRSAISLHYILQNYTNSVQERELESIFSKAVII